MAWQSDRFQEILMSAIFRAFITDPFPASTEGDFIENIHDGELRRDRNEQIPAPSLERIPFEQFELALTRVIRQGKSKLL